MPRIAYVPKNFSAGSRAMIAKANEIIAEYEGQGFTLTLRQLYYQFVARDLIRNRQSEYKRLGSIINDARLAGLIDWNSLEDRTRMLRSVGHWDNPADIVSSAATSFRIDKWKDQDTRLEVWIEKDALVGVIEGVCRSLDVPYFSCRGYTSQSEMWSAAMRFVGYAKQRQDTRIIHFGDHDPSGIDMSRDIEDRIRLFMAQYQGRFDFVRAALNEEQITAYDPPPNPVKLTDSRSAGYQDRYGDESWELDALEPRVIARLIRHHVTEVRDDERWRLAVDEENEHRARLATASKNWSDVEKFIDENFEVEVEEVEEDGDADDDE